MGIFERGSAEIGCFRRPSNHATLISVEPVKEYIRMYLYGRKIQGN